MTQGDNRRQCGKVGERIIINKKGGRRRVSRRGNGWKGWRLVALVASHATAQYLFQ
jgi:hypothetical protein